MIETINHSATIVDDTVIMRIVSKLFLGSSLVATMASGFVSSRSSSSTSTLLLRSAFAEPAFRTQSAHIIGKQQHRLLMGFLSDLFQPPKVSTQKEIIPAFKNPAAVVVDVRSPSEITSQIDAKNWINAPGSPFDCPILREQSATLLPDKSAPIIVYCASGKRSQKAVDILTDLGYENVHNGGGIGELSYLPIKSV